MRAVARTGLTVGEIAAGRWSVDPRDRLLMRIDLSDGADAEEIVRDALNTVTEIELVDDPLGVYHEAVPYEHVIVVGSPVLADNLRLDLPRYFAALAYRRLEFHVQSVPASEGSVCVLFGQLVDARPAAAAGTLRWIGHADEDSRLPRPADPHLGEDLRWSAGQTHGVFALGDTAAGAGLPRIRMPDGASDMALVVEPGSAGPRIRRHAISAPARRDAVCAILGDAEEAEVTADDRHWYYDARFPGNTSGHLRLIPDSAFSRPIRQPDPEHDLLEVLGLFLPRPGDGRGVAGLAIGLTAQRLLVTDGLSTAQSEIYVVGRNERRVRWDTGRYDSIGRRGEVSGLGLRLTAATQQDAVAAAGGPELALMDSGGGPLGWIRLRLGAPDSTDPHHVSASEVRYARHRWIGQSDMTADGAAIYLDWLDTAVRLVGPAPDGARRSGLASYLAETQPASHRFDMLRHDGQALRLVRGEDSVTVRAGIPFRLGPLWVRLRPAEAWA